MSELFYTAPWYLLVTAVASLRLPLFQLRGEHRMVGNLVLLLGLTEEASDSEVKKSYARMLYRLEDPVSEPLSDVSDRLRRVRERLSESYEHWKSTEMDRVRDLLEKCPNGTSAKLGQILVASGVISLECLEETIEEQRNLPDVATPLGDLLLRKGLITCAELDYYIQLQTLIALPPEHPSRWGRRLVALGLVTEDQLRIALIEQQQNGCSVRQALVRRGWLDSATLDRIF